MGRVTSSGRSRGHLWWIVGLHSTMILLLVLGLAPFKGDLSFGSFFQWPAAVLTVVLFVTGLGAQAASLRVLNVLAALCYLVGWGSGIWYNLFPPDVGGAIINLFPVLLVPVGTAISALAIIVAGNMLTRRVGGGFVETHQPHEHLA